MCVCVCVCVRACAYLYIHRVCVCVSMRIFLNNITIVSHHQLPGCQLHDRQQKVNDKNSFAMCERCSYTREYL